METEKRIVKIELRNEKMIVEVTNYGCTILKIKVKDKDDRFTDVVLGYASIEDYQKKSGTYFGALVGRVANRIGNGRFVLNGRQYNVAVNNGPNSLHGGIDGFSYRIFDYKLIENGVQFHYLSEDGEEGYPGNLDLYADYTIENSTLNIEYRAVSDEDTILNITNHSYFNLDGQPGSIEDHYLTVHADEFGCVDRDVLFTGEQRSVENTPFDFRKETRIKDNINREDEQLAKGFGYDHSFIFSQKENQVVLRSEKSKIKLTVSTTLPQAQIYSGNFVDVESGKYGQKYEKRGGICIETQNTVDSINKEENPSVILRKNETYNERTSYSFEVTE